MNKMPQFLSLAVISALLPISLHAVNLIEENPTLYTDISPVDGAVEVSFNATNSATMAELEALSGLGVIYNYSFTGNISGSNNYIIAFDDNARPDVQFTYGKSYSSSVALDNNGFSTSSSTAMRLPGDSNTFTLRIDFGSYDSESDTFTAGAGVSAVGFTLAGNRFDQVDGDIAITYLDASNEILSTQTITSSSSSTIAGFSGYISTENNISAVVISYAGGGLFGLDDVSYTSIPEPSTSSMLLPVLILACLVALRRRND
ncbi:hypothetical protein [Ruficoccus sp. ZRK36]|uniref:hypothetical protein n=1 Tax=Ruficoccus sp. ZRK36 TaxID=2866311 RepID=UPI001C7357A3|nr:hypothetical protein [Ruficoccus sp. ZRK36]QYY36696.1 hypothetical protein K0V07_04290 [Ruficoccus sp. ZRK36]